MRALAVIAFVTAIAAAWACSEDEQPAGERPIDAGSPIDAGDGTCSVDTPFDAPVIVTGLAQGSGAAVSAALSDDERRVVFAIADGVDDGGDGGVALTSLYEAERTAIGDAFANARALSTLNTGGENWPALSSDALTIYFYSIREDRTKAGHVFMATRPSMADAFGAPVKVASLDVEDARMTPHLARHAREIWLAGADRSLAFRIYGAKLHPDGLTDPPAISKELSISGLNATHPVLSADGRSIYWRAYDGDAASPNAGGDIWVATRGATDGPFEAMRPVDELKSPSVDEPVHLSRDRCRLYLMSDRSSRRELYVATRKIRDN